MRLLKALLVGIVCCALLAYYLPSATAFEDNDFAEFEDFDSDDDFVEAPAVQSAGSDTQTGPKEAAAVQEKDAANAGKPHLQDDEEDGIVEDEDEFFKDDEEFEGFDGGEAKEEIVDKKGPEPKLTVAKIPMHFRYVKSY